MHRLQKIKHISLIAFICSAGLLFILFSVVLSPEKRFVFLGRAQTVTPTPSLASDSARFRVSVRHKISQDVLKKYLTVEAVLLGLVDHYSMYYKDLTGETEVTVDPTRAWFPASVIKSFVLPEAFRQRRLGLIDFDTVITIKGENVVSTALETDDYPRLREGVRATIRQLIYAMITQSDNTAYNTLIDILDRRNINATLRSLGITQTVVGEKLNLDDGQFQRDLQVAGRQPNTTTAEDLSTFFNLLYAKKISDSDQILDVFKKQKFNNMIPALLPAGIVVAHKTGVWEPLEHDGGIVYKPQSPFSFVVLTNLGDPTQVAKLARTAYFQSPDTVGTGDTKSLSQESQSLAYNRPIYYADQSLYQYILGAKTDNKFPTVTAEDLGITSNDFNVNAQRIDTIKNPLIQRTSIFYGFKKFVQGLHRMAARTDKQKVDQLIQESKDRLAEAKAAGEARDIESMKSALTESELDLKNATQIAKRNNNDAAMLIRVKLVRDLHYSLLSKISEHTDIKEKEQFIDAVYSFHVLQAKHIDPIISTTFEQNPARQQPVVGTITAIKDNKATVALDNGSQKTVILNDMTPVRSFDRSKADLSPSLQPGVKIAVVGINQAGSVLVPQFILKNIPDELHRHKEGMVIEINPNNNTLKLLDANGKVQTIHVNADTILKSTDTNVSLEGIKVGSKVTVFGTYQQPVPTLPPVTVAPTISLMAPKGSSAQVLISPTIGANSTSTTVVFVETKGPSITPAKTTTAIGQTLPVNPATINATSITVNTNGNGLTEKKQPPANPPQSHPTSIPPTAVPPTHVPPTSVPPTAKPAEQKGSHEDKK